MDYVHRELIGTASRIAREVVAPRAMEADRGHIFPWDNIRELGKAGMHGIGLSEDKGGSGLGRIYFTSVVKELAKACASTALVYVTNSAVLKALEIGACDEIQKNWLPKLLSGNILGGFAVHEPGCGSNAGAIATQAKKEGDSYIVSGTKFFITSAGEADVYLALVRTDPEKGPNGMSILLIEKDTPGLSFGKPDDKMGLTSTSSREIAFDECRVPAKNLIGNEGEGIQIIGKALVGWGFYGAAAISAGLAVAATDLAVKHVKERTIGGQPIAIHQGVQFMIADMALKAEAIEALLEKCANQADAVPASAGINAFKSKLFASETAVDVANTAIQVMGGHGYCREYVVERMFRDARGITLHFKTSEWLRQDIAKTLTGI